MTTFTSSLLRRTLRVAASLLLAALIASAYFGLRPHSARAGAPRGFVVDLRARTVTRVRLPSSCDLDGWSPDGGTITCAAATRVIGLRVDGHIRYAVAGTSPLWSADGVLAIVIEVGDRFGGHLQSVGRFDLDDHGASNLVWLPDGSGLLYEWSARSHPDLWSVQADGSGLHRLTATGNALSDPAWSPNGARLAYASSGFSGGNAGYSSPKVVIADAQGRARSTIESGSEGFAPSWSPDGQRLAVANGFGSELDVVGVDGRGRRLLTNDGSGPAWSPDGSAIAYAGPDGVHLVDPSGSNDRLAIPSAGLYLPPTSVAWSPDARFLAYTTDKGLFVAPADGSARPRLVHAGNAFRPSFSPDGTWLAFSSLAPGVGGHPQSENFLVAVDGTGLHALAPSPYLDGEPAWRPAR